MKIIRKVVLLFAVLSAGEAVGAVMITVPNASIRTNESGHVDVFISSDAGDLLTTTSFEFQISGSPTLNGSLEFRPTTVFATPSYVFNADTGNYVETFDPSVSPYIISASDQFEQGISSVALTATAKVLVRLNLKHEAFGLPEDAVGNVFTIRLRNPGVNDFAFWDESDPLNPGYTSVPIDSASFASVGLITVVSAGGPAAVPEPGSVTLMAFGFIAAVGRKFRSKRHGTPTKASLT